MGDDTRDDEHHYTTMREFLREFTPEVMFPIPQATYDDKPLVICLEKVGGGTLGESYDGNWLYIIFWDDREWMKGRDFETGTPKTHVEAAAELAGLLAAYGDPDSGVENREQKLSARQLEMCQANHVRFQDFADVNGED